MKKNYLSPLSEIVELNLTDVIATSLSLGNGDEDGYGYNGEDWVKG